jgi:hypothetical protein
MEKNRFSNFNYRAWTAAAVSAAFFVPLMVFGAPALAKSAASEYSGSSEYQYTGKVLLCHHTHSKKHPWVQLRIGAPAAKAHLRHHDGDFLGTCPPPTAPAAPASKHGKSGDHGKSGSNDQGDSGSNNGHGNSGNNGHGNSGNNGHGKGK